MQKKTVDKWFVTGLIVSLAIIMVYIFTNTKDNAQSDWATAVLLAREQMRSGQWFPESWVYAQSIWVFSLNLLVIPFLKITNNMLLARELAVAVQTLLCSGVCYLALQRMMNKNSALLVCILLLIPLSPIVNRNFFYEATYYPQIFWLMSLFLITDNLYRVRKHNKWAFCGWMALCVLVCMAITSGDTKELVRIGAPFLGAIVVLLAIKYKEDVKGILTQYRVLTICLLVCLGTGLGLVFQQCVKQNVLFDEGVAKILFSETDEWGNNLSVIFASFAEMYGLDGTGEVVSVNGVLSILKGMMAVLLTLGIPVWSLISFKKLKNFYQRIFVLYSVISAFLMFYICLISQDVGGSARYFLGIYINNMVLAGICFDCTLSENIQWRRLILVLTMSVCVICAIQNRDDSEIDYANYQEMIEFLKEQNVSYGYAEYWSAGVTTVLSNGEVELVAHEKGRQGTPLYWLCSTQWYEDDYHDGDFCFVIKEGEPVEDRYREFADEIHRVGVFEILIYRKDSEDCSNLFVRFPQSVGDVYQISGDNVYWKTTCGRIENGKMVSQGKGFLVYGPYCVLAPGTYRIELEMDVIGKGCSVDLIGGSQVFGSMWCGEGDRFVLDNMVVPERAIGSEVRISVGAETEVKLEQIIVTKVD